MDDGKSAIDPYEAVLADLRAKQERIAQAIAFLESLRGLAIPAIPVESGATAPPRIGGSDVQPGMFHGMTIPEAAKKLLELKKQNLTSQEIAAALKSGGLVLQSEDPANTIGSVLNRRFEKVGDVVRVARGTWGLSEWHPSIRFKAKGEKKPEPESDK